MYSELQFSSTKYALLQMKTVHTCKEGGLFPGAPKIEVLCVFTHKPGKYISL